MATIKIASRLTVSYLFCSRPDTKVACSNGCILRGGQPDATCWCNIDQHCWTQPVALVSPPHCMSLNQVWFSSNFVFNDRPTFLLLSGVNNKVVFVRPPCSTLLNTRMPTELVCRYMNLLRWFISLFIFARWRVNVQDTVWRTSKVFNLTSTNA